MKKTNENNKSFRTKVQRKDFLHFVLTLSTGLVIFGLIVWFGKGSLLKNNYQFQQSLIKANSATKSAQEATAQSKIIHPSPAPVATIPQNYGKSVRVPILTYHYIGANPNPGKDPARDNLSVVPELFDAQMGYLVQNGYNAISLDTLVAALNGQAKLPIKPVVLTFDDGYIDFYINAFPILQKYSLHVTSFIPTHLIGTSYYMSWGQIHEITASGLVLFEAHSLTHPNLTLLPPEKAKQEISQSKKELEAQIGSPVNFFAYPYGASNAYIWKYVQEAGFIGAVGTWSSNVENEGNIYDMPRIKIAGGTSVEKFAKLLQ